MIKSEIFEGIVSCASTYFENGEKTFFGLLFAFASTTALNEDVIKENFEEDGVKEVKEFASLFAEHKTDCQLLVSICMVLAECRNNKKEDRAAMSIIVKALKDETEWKAYQILEELLKIDYPEKHFSEKGSDIDDFYDYVIEKEDLGEYKRITDEDVQDEQAENINEYQDPDEGKEPKERFCSLIERSRLLYDRLIHKVMGQNEAIRMVVQGIFQAEVLKHVEDDKKSPSATFLFAGPSGVGKTYMSSLAAEYLGRPFMKFDMSEYNSSYAKALLFDGLRDGKAGRLINYVRENPKAVILFDEIEKASPAVVEQFLQILDSGEYTDSTKNKKVSFKDTILFFTTNAGRHLYDNYKGQKLSTIPQQVVLKEISENKDQKRNVYFPPELCSRFASGNVIMFNNLSAYNLINIANERFRLYGYKIYEEYGYDISISNKLSNVLLFSMGGIADARTISSGAVSMLKNELYEFGRHIKDLKGNINSIERIVFDVDDSIEKREVRELFDNEETSTVLFVGDKETIANVPFGDKCNVVSAKNVEEAMDTIVEEDIQFVLIDPLFGAEESEEIYLSLDDRKSEGIRAFETLSDKFTEIPFYMIEKEVIDDSDKHIFLERGVREFIEFKTEIEFADKVAKICYEIFLQKKAEELSGKGRVLEYNTSQSISEDGKTAILKYYDFKIKIAKDADESQMMIEENEIPEDRFDDIIGAKDAVDELKHFVDYIKNPKKYIAKGEKMGKGIFLYGPPGTGKTLLARAMAGECGVTFIPTTGADFIDSLAGESERKVKQLFATAKKFAPSIIFMDEIDAIGKERTGTNNSLITESTLNTFLTEMDGFEVNESKPVFVIAATNYDIDKSQSNRETVIDPALIRRFDNKIYVDLPNESERLAYLKMEFAKNEASEVTEECMENIAQRSMGQSLAILNRVIRLSVRNASRDDKNVNDTYLLDAFEQYLYGEKREKSDEFKNVAIHESGHAYIATLSGNKPTFITINSRSNFGGYVQPGVDESKITNNKEELIWEIRTALAGRAAEIEFFGEEKGINTGIASDLGKATNTAMDMICCFGMDEKMVSISPEQLLNSPSGKELIERIDAILKDEMENTRRLIRDGKDKVQALADFLVENNQANGEEIAEILDK